MVRTRAATRAVLTRISGVPGRTPATATTSDSGTRRVPVTTTERTANRLESNSAQVTPPATPIAASRSKTATHRALRRRVFGRRVFGRRGCGCRVKTAAAGAAVAVLIGEPSTASARDGSPSR